MGKSGSNFVILCSFSLYLIHLAGGDVPTNPFLVREANPIRQHLLRSKNPSFTTGRTASYKDKIYFPDTCFLNGNPATPGVCKSFQECPTALKKPQRCPLEGSSENVCCEVEIDKAGPDTSLFRRTAPRRAANGCQVMDEKDAQGALNDNLSNGAFGGIGVPSVPGEFPYMVALGWVSPDPEDRRITYLCGGVLFIRGFVLTAAHCRSINGVAPKVVRLGDEPLSDFFYIEPLEIKRFISHPDYNGMDIYNDIAIIELEGDFTFIQHACLWLDENYPTINVTAIGYGQTGFGAPPSDVLIKADMFLTPNKECSEHYPKSEDLPRGLLDSQLCAGDRVQRRDTCQGDSGGPMVIKMTDPTNKGGPVGYVVGITSIGKPCGRGDPGIYTKVSHYIDWIEHIVGTN